MNLKKSPLAPAEFAELQDIDGVQKWVGETGVKYENRADILLVKIAENSRVAGVFTKSAAPGAPVTWSRECLKSHCELGIYREGAGILVNAGNANVFTGRAGQESAKGMAALGARILGCAQENMYVASTGVIGEPLDIGPIIETVEGQGFLSQEADWERAAQAISTTDTYLKGSGKIIEIDGQTVSISGIAKGSGMIAPDMATMLSFIFTDANIGQNLLQIVLAELSDKTFNAITVDSDTSTSDTMLLVATGQAKHSQIDAASDPGFEAFKSALNDVMIDLAHQVVKDGEGAQKFIEINVSGATSPISAKNIGMSIANSPLVKTAIAGEDANWGRIVMAIGKAGEPADRDRLKISFGPHLVAENGKRATDYDENQVTEYLRGREIRINVDLGLKNGEFTVWTCDLTHGYIDINADYRS